MRAFAITAFFVAELTATVYLAQLDELAQAKKIAVEIDGKNCFQW